MTFRSMFLRLPLTKDDPAHRRPVWLALSDLFLDTDTTLFEENVMKTLLASPYSLPEIEAILIHEVRPVCMWNAFAWVWDGFDPDWLTAKIQCQRHTGFSYVYLFFSPIGWATLRNDSQWQRIRGRFAAARATINDFIKFK